MLFKVPPNTWKGMDELYFFLSNQTQREREVEEKSVITLVYVYLYLNEISRVSHKVFIFYKFSYSLGGSNESIKMT